MASHIGSLESCWPIRMDLTADRKLNPFDSYNHLEDSIIIIIKRYAKFLCVKDFDQVENWGYFPYSAGAWRTSRYFFENHYLEDSFDHVGRAFQRSPKCVKDFEVLKCVDLSILSCYVAHNRHWGVVFKIIPSRSPTMP